MKPDVDLVLQGFFGTLLMDVAPHLNAEYSMGNVGIMGMMMFMTAEEHDRAAEIRVAENTEIRALFGEAARVVEDTGLKTRLGEAAASCDASLRIKALDQSNAALSGLLVELQAHVETSKAAWAGPLEARIWDYLVAATERRKLPFPSLG
ncbi:hypothetical protein [uncultured Parvibaculum sp.]|uniref:hypothetical protein n=1 Tax=uncultured Parvibaculum sp. TaxID=291828 RepID=UPI0030DA8894|tara:strand:+ start:29682 stop:30131 length:450 start_codon:yes stop_codon:yes gene_type:complete